MFKKRKIVIFNVHSEGERLGRFKEEIKNSNLEMHIINSYNVAIADSGIFYNGKEIVFKKGDIAWFVANPTINHYLAEYLQRKFDVSVMVWPDAQAVELSDKFCVSVFFNSIDIPTPKTVLINSFKEEKIELLAKNYVNGFPCVIKSCRGSMGKNVDIVNSPREILAFIDKAFKAKSIVPFKRSSFLLQEFIKESAGSDFRALCLNGEVLGMIRRTSQDGNFKANISLGGKAEIVELDKDVKKMAEKITREGKIFYAGIDFIKSDRGYLAIEINTSAQFKGFEKATGINVAEKIMKKLIEKKIK